MNTKARKKGSLLILICSALFAIIKCNTESSNIHEFEGISIQLKKVLTNYPAQKVDTITPLPEIVFILAFKNNTKQDYILRLQNIMTGENSNLSAEINCSNGALAILPLYQNTGRNSLLQKQSEIVLTFKAKWQDVLSELGKCGNGYLGEIIKRETENLTIVYKTDELTFKSHCIRRNFESPEYFLLE